ncbi:MAG: hypothetical protein ACI9S8_000459 [Chlamydiales bacterium]|jgi:hypothetical protein
MIPDSNLETVIQSFQQQVEMGILTQDQVHEMLSEYHDTPVVVKKTNESLDIFFTDSLGFAKSMVLKRYCLHLGSLKDQIPHMNLYISPQQRQHSHTGCSSFAIRDLKKMLQHPELLSYMKENSTPSEMFWNDPMYPMMLGGASEPGPLDMKMLEIHHRVQEEFEQKQKESSEGLDLGEIDPQQAMLAFAQFMMSESEVYRGFTNLEEF